MNYLMPERLDRLAREYALGTLAGPARRRFERVLQSSRAAGLAVDVWRERLAVLEQAAAPMAPPAATWLAIERRLFLDSSASVAAQAPAGGWRSTVRGWFSGRLLGSSLAGMLAGALMCVALVRLQPGWAGLEPQTDGVSPSYIGILVDRADKPVLVVSSRRLGRQLTMKLLQPLALPPGQVAQLWALPKDGAAPFPMGVLPTKGSAQILLPETSEKLFFSVPKVAVSFELAPAKPGDKPSSGFLLSGNCVKVW